MTRYSAVSLRTTEGGEAISRLVSERHRRPPLALCAYPSPSRSTPSHLVLFVPTLALTIGHVLW